MRAETPKTYESFWRRGRLKFLRIAILGFPFYILALAVPKNPNIEVFGSFNGYAVADNSLGQFARQMSSRRTYYSHGIFDFTSPLIMGAEVVALQHGFPVKLGGVASPLYSWLMRQPFRLIFRWCIPYVYVYYADVVHSPGGIFLENSRRVFQLTKARVIEDTPARLDRVKVNPIDGKVLVALTQMSSISILDRLRELGLIYDLEHSLREVSIPEQLKIFVRPHPVELSLVGADLLKTNVFLDTTKDIYDTLGSYSIVITDFSSLGFDSEELGVETLYWTQYLDEFMAEEIGLFEDIKELLSTRGLIQVSDIWSRFD